MASKLKNLSSYKKQDIPSVAKMHFGIVVSEWNKEITDALLTGAVLTLTGHKAVKNNIKVIHVPGSFELPAGAQYLLRSKKMDAVICLGCVIQGETRHFEFICNAVSEGIMKINLDYNTPVIFGLLTTNSLQQAKDRSGGKHGNKGIEAAVTAIKMALLKKEILKKK
jgi:6,7-dimethyl-8-ribityllumazine synthase